ncbi:hypothetical protein CSIM01_00580 [Colletotrichum simmondsii]|uniref:Uncharacterized protein n=1 Tax=Colletotrichum simmondsii TaxID=703756 RepID=A0A135SJ23_9PEZI|nr:hypothetical protein CSIM01_00580 [Colletotrichum simmondsii]
MCAAPAPRPSLCPLHDGSDRRHLVPEPAQYFATFPKTKGAEEIQIIKWYLLKGFNTLTRLGLRIHRRSVPGEPQQKYSKHGDLATVLDYLSLQNFSKRQHGRGYPLSILKRQTNFMEHLESMRPIGLAMRVWPTNRQATNAKERAEHETNAPGATVYRPLNALETLPTSAPWTLSIESRYLPPIPNSQSP